MQADWKREKWILVGVKRVKMADQNGPYAYPGRFPGAFKRKRTDRTDNHHRFLMHCVVRLKEGLKECFFQSSGLPEEDFVNENGWISHY